MTMGLLAVALIARDIPKHDLVRLQRGEWVVDSVHAVTARREWVLSVEGQTTQVKGLLAQIQQTGHLPQPDGSWLRFVNYGEASRVFVGSSGRVVWQLRMQRGSREGGAASLDADPLFQGASVLGVYCGHLGASFLVSEDPRVRAQRVEALFGRRARFLRRTENWLCYVPLSDGGRVGIASDEASRFLTGVKAGERVLSVSLAEGRIDE